MTCQTLNDDLLNEFIYGFYGYGDYGARYWFIGMEEGGGHSEEEIARRLNAWKEAGKEDLLDLLEYHQAIGVTHWFDGSGKLQRTWSALIRSIPGATNPKVSPADVREQVRAYQKSRLGRRGEESCLIELLPLPSPAKKCWHYDNWSRLPFLASRDEYEKRVCPRRIEEIRGRVMRHKPPVVVFYGSSYRRYWSEIARVEFQQTSDEGILTARNDRTLFVFCRHPAFKGVSNAYFHQVGTIIASQAPR